MNQLWALHDLAQVLIKGKYKQCYIKMQRIKLHTVHIIENKAHHLALNLDGFIQ